MVFSTPLIRKTQKPTLDQLLAQLPEDQRTAVEIGAVRAHLSANPEHAQKATAFYQDKHSGQELMAHFALQEGDVEKALGILEQNSLYIEKAAELALKHLGMERAVQVYERAIAKEGIGYYHEQLAKFYLKHNDKTNAKKEFTKAMEKYEQTRNPHRAINLAKEHGTLDDVLGIYHRAAQSSTERRHKITYYTEGAEFAEKNNRPQLAAQMYESALDAHFEEDRIENVIGLSSIEKEDLIKLARKVGNKEKLLAAYEKTHNAESAYHLALELGYVERAKNIILKEINDPNTLAMFAKNALHKNQLELALELYEHAGLDKDLARTAIQYNKPQKALDICLPKIDVNEENGYFRDPEYFILAMLAAGNMGKQELRKTIAQKAITRFAVLGEFAHCATFAESIGYEASANIYKKIASLPEVK